MLEHAEWSSLCSTMLSGAIDFGTGLRESQVWLVHLHCACHRLALAAKDACEECTVMVQTDMLLRGCFALVSGGKNKAKLAEISKCNDETENALSAFANARWLSRGGCLVRVAEKAESVLEMAVLKTKDKKRSREDDEAPLNVEDGTITRKRMKPDEVVKRMTTFRTLFPIYFLADMVGACNQLSCQLQKTGVSLRKTILEVQATRNGFESSYCDPKTPIRWGPWAKSFLERFGDVGSGHLEDAVVITFGGQRIKVTPDEFEVSLKEARECARAIRDALDLRFPDFDLLLALLVTDPAEAVGHEKELDYGDESIEVLAEHFGQVGPLGAFIDRERLVSEWARARVILLKDTTQSKQQFRRRLANEGDLVNILKLVCAEDTSPCENALVERGFSNLVYIKSKWANMLGEMNLESRMRLSEAAPPVGSQKELEMVEKVAHDFWLSPKRCPARSKGAIASAAVRNAKKLARQGEKDEEARAKRHGEMNVEVAGFGGTEMTEVPTFDGRAFDCVMLY